MTDLPPPDRPPPLDTDTWLLHGDQRAQGRDAADRSVTPSIPYSATFVARDAQDFAEMASQARHPRYYTRYGNPLHDRVATLVAELEGAESGLCFASGMGGISSALLGLLKAGDHVVAQRNHYMATSKLMTELLPRYGVQVDLVEQTDSAAFAAAIRPGTRLVHLETPANPTLALTDIAAVSAIAHARGALVSVDNTFASPLNQRPIAHGADLVMHSATKFLGGHHDLTAGVVVGPRDLCEAIWSTAITLGATLSPMDAWLLLRGLRTLGVRVRQQNRTALAVAQFLEAHPAVERVFHPGLESHPQHALARRQMDGGFGSLMAVWLRGDYACAARFVAGLGLFTHAVSLGGVESLAVHAAAMWAGTMNDEQMWQSGVLPNAVRLSIGLENEADLCADLARALAACRMSAGTAG
jgi:cystathionine beta-lyase/cystathionine gamma-synthase